MQRKINTRWMLRLGTKWNCGQPDKTESESLIEREKQEESFPDAFVEGARISSGFNDFTKLRLRSPLSRIRLISIGFLSPTPVPFFITPSRCFYFSLGSVRCYTSYISLYTPRVRAPYARLYVYKFADVLFFYLRLFLFIFRERRVSRQSSLCSAVAECTLSLAQALEEEAIPSSGPIVSISWFWIPASKGKTR